MYMSAHLLCNGNTGTNANDGAFWHTSKRNGTDIINVLFEYLHSRSMYEFENDQDLIYSVG